MPQCDFNKVAIEIILKHGCSPVNLLAAYFQNIFSQKHFCVATSGSSTYQKSLILFVCKCTLNLNERHFSRCLMGIL